MKQTRCLLTNLDSCRYRALWFTSIVAMTVQFQTISGALVPILRPQRFIQHLLHTNDDRRMKIVPASLGGRSSGTLSVAVSDASLDNRERTSDRKRGMTIALASSYCTVMFAKCALPSVLSLLMAPDTGLSFPPGAVPQQLMAKLLTVATLGVAAGKFLLGPVIDYFGGKVSLQVALSCLSVLLLITSFSQSFAVFGVAWIAIDFLFSSCWPACINTIYCFFDKSDWPDQIGNLAASARVGNSLAFVTFAFIINFVERYNIVKQSWRPVFLAASCIQLIPIVLLSIFGGTGYDEPSSKVQRSSTNAAVIGSSLSVVYREMKTPDFWLHLISRSMLMIYASFLMFVPTLMTQVYRTSPSFGAQVGSFYALGCLLSVTTLSKVFVRLSKRSKLRLTTVLLFFGASGSSLLQLAHVSGYLRVTPAASGLLLFIWGFSFAIPFYVPPSLYALSRGGKESSATITDVFDVGGFALLAIFNGYVASIRHHQPTAWIPTFIITTCCSLFSFIALFIATWRETL
jgi:MFS family permease